MACEKNGKSNVEPPIAGVSDAAPSDAVNVKSPFSVAEAPAVPAIAVERSPSVAIATPNLPRKVFVMVIFPPKESGAYDEWTRIEHASPCRTLRVVGKRNVTTEDCFGELK
jgi:hypothetical protein